jgi:hypothetical protein
VEPLSNPVWCSLRTGHAHFAQGDATIAGYPADVAPFAAVSRDGDRPADARSGVSRLLPDKNDGVAGLHRSR